MAAGTLNAAILDTLAEWHPDREYGMVLPAYTLPALATVLDTPERLVRDALTSLMMAGFVITRTHRRSGETLYKVPDEYHSRWAAQAKVVN